MIDYALETFKHNHDNSEVMKLDLFQDKVPENLEAFTTPIDMKNESGQSFGTCEFPSTSQLVCTFNEMVEKLENIRGELLFYSKGWCS